MDIKNRLSFRTSGILSNIDCDRSGHSTMRIPWFSSHDNHLTIIISWFSFHDTHSMMRILRYALCDTHRGGSRSRTSTWSVLMKAYTNKPFRFFGWRHNCALEIKQAICILESVRMYLQHCLSFPDPRPFSNDARLVVRGFQSCAALCALFFCII